MWLFEIHSPSFHRDTSHLVVNARMIHWQTPRIAHNRTQTTPTTGFSRGARWFSRKSISVLSFIMAIEYPYREPVARCARLLLMKTPSKTLHPSPRSRTPRCVISGSTQSTVSRLLYHVPLLLFARSSLLRLVVCLLKNPAFPQYTSNTVRTRLHRWLLLFA